MAVVLSLRNPVSEGQQGGQGRGRQVDEVRGDKGRWGGGGQVK